MKQKRREHSPKQSDDAPNELQKILAARRGRADSVDATKPASPRLQSNSEANSELKELTKSINKQPSLDGATPTPKPRPRISQRQHPPQVSSELASKLTSALNRIPDEAQNGSSENPEGESDK